MRDGRITDAKYDINSGNETLDRAAYLAILTSPLRPLPSEFPCEFIDLRFRFRYNPDNADTIPEPKFDQVVPCVTSKI